MHFDTLGFSDGPLLAALLAQYYTCSPLNTPLPDRYAHIQWGARTGRSAQLLVHHSSAKRSKHEARLRESIIVSS